MFMSVAAMEVDRKTQKRAELRRNVPAHQKTRDKDDRSSEPRRTDQPSATSRFPQTGKNNLVAVGGKIVYKISISIVIQG